MNTGMQRSRVLSSVEFSSLSNQAREFVFSSSDARDGIGTRSAVFAERSGDILNSLTRFSKESDRKTFVEHTEVYSMIRANPAAISTKPEKIYTAVMKMRKSNADQQDFKQSIQSLKSDVEGLVGASGRAATDVYLVQSNAEAKLNRGLGRLASAQDFEAYNLLKTDLNYSRQSFEEIKQNAVMSLQKGETQINGIMPNAYQAERSTNATFNDAKSAINLVKQQDKVPTSTLLS